MSRMNYLSCVYARRKLIKTNWAQPFPEITFQIFLTNLFIPSNIIFHNAVKLDRAK